MKDFPKGVEDVTDIILRHAIVLEVLLFICLWWAERYWNS